MARAPVWLQVMFYGWIFGGLYLTSRHLISDALLLSGGGALGIATFVWGSIRCRRSPSVWDQVAAHLDAGDQEAADRLVEATGARMDEELERLRSAAPGNESAAHEFRRRTEAELIALNRNAARVSTANGKIVMERLRKKLEADLDWVARLPIASGR